jgi:anti-sigma factor RsiW
MRFRKVRSYLSAYCSGELSDRRQEQLREELAGSEALRRELAAFEAIREAAREIPQESVSDDFNARLLNRIAEERFKETRSKAYLPQSGLAVGFRKLVPALASVAVLALAVIGFWPGAGEQLQVGNQPVASASGDRHLSVQPTDNPNMSATFSQPISLQNLIARVDRADEISNLLTRSNIFGGHNGVPAVTAAAAHDSRPLPFNTTFFRVRPILKVSQPVTGRQEEEIY